MVDLLANAYRILDQVNSDTAVNDPQGKILRHVLSDFALVKRAFARSHSRWEGHGGRQSPLAFELVASLTLGVIPATRSSGRWSVAAVEAAEVCRMLRVAARGDVGGRDSVLLHLVPICWALIHAHPLLNNPPIFVLRQESLRQICAVNDLFEGLDTMSPLPCCARYAAGVLAAISRPRNARLWVASALRAARAHGAYAFVRFFRPFVEPR
jgi:hypothetical protein